MGKRTIIEEYKIGDLVRWFELYADGFACIDTGMGIILEKRDISCDTKLYTQYHIYRTKHNDKMYFSFKELEKIV
jgi:hypothetical protein